VCILRPLHNHTRPPGAPDTLGGLVLCGVTSKRCRMVASAPCSHGGRVDHNIPVNRCRIGAYCARDRPRDARNAGGRIHRDSGCALRHPGGDGAPILAVVLRSWSAERRPQLLVLRGGQEVSVWACQTPLVLDALWPTGIVAARDLANPVGGVPVMLAM